MRRVLKSLFDRCRCKWLYMYANIHIYPLYYITLFYLLSFFLSLFLSLDLYLSSPISLSFSLTYTRTRTCCVVSSVRIRIDW